MANGDLNTEFRVNRSSGSRDMLADRETDRQTDRRVITVLRTPTGAEGLGIGDITEQRTSNKMDHIFLLFIICNL